MRLMMKQSNMPDIISFEGFKFQKTEFIFKNKKQMNKFFDAALIESTQKFIRLNDQMLLEKMHVLFSWYMLLKVSAYVFISLAIIFFQSPVLYFFGISSIILFIVSLILSKKLNNTAFSRTFINAINQNSDSLEAFRETLINKTKC